MANYHLPSLLRHQQNPTSSSLSSSSSFCASPLPPSPNHVTWSWDRPASSFRLSMGTLSSDSTRMSRRRRWSTSLSSSGWVSTIPITSSGFCGQVADLASGRSAPMNEEQIVEAEKKITGKFSDIKHVRGILSMGRYEDPNSAQSSFTVLLGNAPHLDGQYAIFGKVTKGYETLRKLEELPTRREGIFVMPTERITIHSLYYYVTKMEVCEEENLKLRRRLAASAIEIERQRMKCFP